MCSLVLLIYYLYGKGDLNNVKILLHYLIGDFNMLIFFLQGLLLGFSYVAPIGTQNLYIINSALEKTRLKAYETAFITIFFDISLGISCFFGIGFLIEKFSTLKSILLLVGSLMVIYIGVGLIRSLPNTKRDIKVDSSMLKIAGTCFIVTWLNPQAIIDGSLLLGSFRATLSIEMSKYFIFGVCTASFLWFTTLTTLVLVFKNIFNVAILKWLNRVCGSIIIFYGIKLLFSLIKPS